MAIDEKAIFMAAMAMSDAKEREAYLQEACAGHPELLNRVRELLSAHEESRGPLDRRPAALGVTVDEPIREGGGTVIGPYKLLEQIGEGGFGVVFMAEQTHPVRRKVALKILKPGMDTRQVVARFEAERQALAIMDHPNIAKVFDGGMTGSGRPYFVMELVKGVPITQFCDEQKLSPRQRLELFLPVCQAVQHAHQKGIIHRDLKPSNVLVSCHDTTPIVKVIDFGVAKALGQELTDKTLFTGIAQMIGTPLYMSPEQAGMSDLDVDTRSDIYSLGVLLYELLTGTTPFAKERFKTAAYDEIRRIIREEDPPRPSTRLCDSKDSLSSISAQRQTEPAKLTELMRGELDWIVMKALEKDRNRRYETANGFAMDVQRYLADEPVQACPPSTSYRLRKFARKHRAALTAIGTFAVLLVGGVIASTWQAARATRAEHEMGIALAQKNNALHESEEARRQAESVTAYLKTLLRSPDPRQDSRATRLVDILERAAAELDANFPDSPKIRADLLTTIGESYAGLRLYKETAQIFVRARALYQDILGPDHPDTLAATKKLAWAYRGSGRASEAIPLAEKILTVERAKLGVDDRETLDSASLVGDIYRYAGRPLDGIRVLEPALALCKEKFGASDRVTLDIMNNLGWCYHRAGRLPEAIAMFEQMLLLNGTARSVDHPETLNFTSNLGEAYLSAGRFADAVRLLEPSLKLCQSRLGQEHPFTKTTIRTLVKSYEALGRGDEAKRLQQLLK
jgi:serine/threonine protein kinase